MFQDLRTFTALYNDITPTVSKFWTGPIETNTYTRSLIEAYSCVAGDVRIRPRNLRLVVILVSCGPSSDVALSSGCLQRRSGRPFPGRRLVRHRQQPLSISIFVRSAVWQPVCPILVRRSRNSTE